MKEKTNTRSRIYVLPWIALFLFVNLFFLVNGVGKTLARQALDKLIERELPEHYLLDYEVLEFKIFEQELTVKNLNFIPRNDIRLAGIQRSFRINIPHFKIQLKSIRSILLEQELIIEGISIIDPQFSVVDFSKNQRLTASTESINLLELVGQYLHFLKIKTLKIENAGLQYQKRDKRPGGSFSLQEFDFHLNQFVLDSNLSKQNFLNAESIELIINQQQFFLSDNIHKFSFDQLRLSTKDSVLNFHNLKMEPIDSITRQNWTAASGPALYEVHIPQVDLNGIDFYESYVNNDLRMDQVVFQEPDIRIKGGNKRLREASKPNQSAVLNVLSQFAPSLHFKNIQLNQGQVRLDYQETRSRDLHFLVDHLNLYDCFIQPNNFDYSERNPPFREFNLQLRNLKQHLPDQIHQLSIEKIMISGREKEIDLFNLNLEPYSEVPHASKTKIVQQIPFLRIGGIDYLGFLQQKPLSISELYLMEPNTTLISPIEGKKDSIPFDLRYAKKIIGNSILKELNTDLLRINKGNLVVDDWFSVEDYNFMADNIQLDNSTESWSSVTDTFSINVESLDFQKDSLGFNLMGFLSNGQDHFLQKLNFSRISSLDSTTLYLQGLEVFQTDLDEIMTGKYECDSINVNDLSIDIKLKPGKKGKVTQVIDLSSPVHTPQFRLDQLNLILESPTGDSLKVNKLSSEWRLDSTVELNKLDLAGLMFKPQNGPQIFSVNRIKKESVSRESYQIFGFEVLPNDSVGSWPHHLSFPHIKIKEWDRNRFLEQRQWVFKKIVLDQADFSIRNPKGGEIVEQKNSTLSLPIVFLDSLQLKRTKLDFNKGDSIQLAIANFDFELQGLNTKKQMVTATGISDLYRSFHLNIGEGLTFSFPQLQGRISALDVKDKETSDWLFYDLLLENQTSSIKHNTHLESLSLNNFSIEKLLKKNELILDSLVFGQMITSIFDSEGNEASSNDKLNQIKLPFQRIDIGLIQMQEAYLDLHIDKPLSLEKASIIAKGVSADSVIQTHRLNDYFESLQLGLNNFSYQLGKYKEYKLSQSIQYNSIDKQLVVSNASLEPQVSKTAFSELIPHQEDFFAINCDSLLIDGFELNKLFVKPLHWPKIRLAELDLNIFRDQNLVHPNNPQDLIQEQIKAIKYPLIIDTIELTTNIDFTILPENAEEEGNINFLQLSGKLLHFTNQDSLWDRPLQVHAKGDLYGDIELEADIEFDMSDPMNNFILEGRVGRMEIPEMNNILLPTSRIFIRKGKSKEILFNISGNKDVAIGDMFFRYNKLKFRIVDKDDIHHTSFGNSLLSFWANRLVKSNNPSFLRKRKGVIYFERNPNRAIFHYWSRALLSGVVSSVGVKNNKKQLKRLGLEHLEALNYDELFGEKQ